MKPSVTIKVNDMGEYEVSVKGAKGQHCESITKTLIAALGDVVTSQKTPEYYEKDLTATIKNKI